ncbi:DDE transposase family protein [Verrucomicrobium sp. 3C]|uniref:DDE transposase family protein n=1 Tax=Verrucomicrobium sp. 3C TaxID=1134055 RepID=UPI001E2AE1D5|nr:DDE transposase family protein [Verrucomicrobium sp. 3C]
MDWIRGHWGGAEIRNHWRRDVLRGEDRSHSRQANLLANLALIRNALLSLLSERLGEPSLPHFRERLLSSLKQCLAIRAAAGTPKQKTLGRGMPQFVRRDPRITGRTFRSLSGSR